ncbi:MAG TPA: STAS domain-containing protein [Spirochaetia bacterium]|nr:STAS domain-containing protein [Spirochaetia bacterium]
MTNEIQPLETVNALLIEPSAAFGVAGHPDLAVIRVGAAPEWATELDRVVAGCVVLGFRTVILQLEGAEIASSFHIACLASAWRLLIDRGGTLVLCQLSEAARRRLGELVEESQFNIFDSVEDAIEWLDTAYVPQMHKSFPRAVKCVECGAGGEVSRRGDHVCTECAVTYLVTERGELLF